MRSEDDIGGRLRKDWPQLKRMVKKNAFGLASLLALTLSTLITIYPNCAQAFGPSEPPSTVSRSFGHMLALWELRGLATVLVSSEPLTRCALHQEWTLSLRAWQKKWQKASVTTLNKIIKRDFLFVPLKNRKWRASGLAGSPINIVSEHGLPVSSILSSHRLMLSPGIQ